MKQLILVFETRASCESDYIYVKAAIDHFYVERRHKITPIYAKTKSELINCEKRIQSRIDKNRDDSKVILFADYDKKDDPNNAKIEKYCLDKSFDLVWLNLDIEEVFLGRRVEKRAKEREALNFLKKKQTYLSSNQVLANPTPLDKHPSSNLLLVLDRHLRRKHE